MLPEIRIVHFSLGFLEDMERKNKSLELFLFFSKINHTKPPADA